MFMQVLLALAQGLLAGPVDPETVADLHTARTVSSDRLRTKIVSSGVCHSRCFASIHTPVADVAKSGCHYSTAIGGKHCSHKSRTNLRGLEDELGRAYGGAGDGLLVALVNRGTTWTSQARALAGGEHSLLCAAAHEDRQLGRLPLFLLGCHVSASSPCLGFSLTTALYRRGLGGSHRVAGGAVPCSAPTSCPLVRTRRRGAPLAGCEHSLFGPAAHEHGELGSAPRSLP